MGCILGTNTERVYGISCPRCTFGKYMFFENYMIMRHAWNTKTHEIEHVLQCPTCEAIFAERDFDKIVAMYDTNYLNKVEIQ